MVRGSDVSSWIKKKKKNGKKHKVLDERELKIEEDMYYVTSSHSWITLQLEINNIVIILQYCCGVHLVTRLIVSYIKIKAGLGTVSHRESFHQSCKLPSGRPTERGQITKNNSHNNLLLLTLFLSNIQMCSRLHCAAVIIIARRIREHRFIGECP